MADLRVDARSNVDDSAPENADAESESRDFTAILAALAQRQPAQTPSAQPAEAASTQPAEAAPGQVLTYDEIMLNRGEGRKLTSGEIEVAARLFGDSFDPEPIRVYNFDVGDGEPASLGNDIYSGKYYETDYSNAEILIASGFFHEETHPWQYQNGIDPDDAILDRDLKNAGGDYSKLYEYKLEPGKNFYAYNSEQQAEMVRDLFLLTNNYRSVKGHEFPSLPDLLGVLPFDQFGGERLVPTDPIDYGDQSAPLETGQPTEPLMTPAPEEPIMTPPEPLFTSANDASPSSAPFVPTEPDEIPPLPEPGAGGASPSGGAAPAQPSPPPAPSPAPASTPPTSSPVSEQDLGVMLADLLGEEDAPPTGGDNTAPSAAPPQTPEELGVPSSDDALDDMQDLLDGVPASGDADDVDEDEDDADTDAPPPPSDTGGSERPAPDGDQRPLELSRDRSTPRPSPGYLDPNIGWASMPTPDGDQQPLELDPGSRRLDPVIVNRQPDAVRPVPIEIDDTSLVTTPSVPNYNGPAGAIMPSPVEEPLAVGTPGGGLATPFNPDPTIMGGGLERLQLV